MTLPQASHSAAPQSLSERSVNWSLVTWLSTLHSSFRVAPVKGLLLAVMLLSPLVSAQGTPKVTGVDPSSGKVNDSVTVMGESLDKGSVVGVFLSDDKTDYKATIVNQAADKIVMKVPQVKPGGYNVSIQVGNGILIEPVRFTVQQ
jgi:hypothetical protein